MIDEGTILTWGKDWLFGEAGIKQYKGHSIKQGKNGTFYFFRGTVEKSKRSVRCLIRVYSNGELYPPQSISSSKKKQIGKHLNAKGFLTFFE